jgi:metallo-beta-lactamase family protein
VPFDVGALDGVVITHAHLDHVGHVPLLVRDGYAGRIHATADTVALAGIVLADSGRLHEEEARFAARRGYSRHDPPRPLYTEHDALVASTSFHAHEFGVPFEPAPGVTAVLRPAGHILGSSVVELRIGDVVLTVTGDLGRDCHPMLAPPAPPGRSDVLVIESTYGDRVHPPESAAVDRLAEAVTDTARRGGRVVIPAFAVDRTEVVLHALQSLTVAGAIPALPVFVDSPMALAALEVYEAALDRGAADLRAELHDGKNLYPHLDLRPAHSVEESKRIDELAYPAIVVSASGMATGGRVLHHLKAMLGDPRSTVVLAGFQAAGTRGRALLEGARAIKLLGQYVSVRAKVVDVTGLSQHADADELLRWVEGAPEPPGTVFVVHGEPEASAALADRFEERGITAIVPRYDERVVIAGA